MHYLSSATRYFVVSLSTSSLVLPLLSGGYFLNISSAARGLCCLRRSVDIFSCLSINQAASSQQVSVGASAGIISLLDLLEEPSTACKAGVDTVQLHRPDICEGGQLLQPRGTASTHRADPTGVSATDVCCCPSASITAQKTTQKTFETRSV